MYVSSNLLQENIRCISQERQQLIQEIKDEIHQKEQLKKIKSEMENEQWQLNKTIEKLKEEVWAHFEEAAISLFNLGTIDTSSWGWNGSWNTYLKMPL